MTDFEPLRYGDLLSKVEQTWETKEGVYTRPAMAVSLRVLSVSVPVLSKQQISNFPAKGMRKGSVQNTP